MSSASIYFANNGFDEIKKKPMMVCTFCRKRLIKSGNSNCYSSHLQSCRPNLNKNTNNNIQRFPKTLPVEVELAFTPTKSVFGNFSTISSPACSSEKSTSIKQSSSTPIKAFLLSKAPYAQDSVERFKLIDSVINCIKFLSIFFS